MSCLKDFKSVAHEDNGCPPHIYLFEIKIVRSARQGIICYTRLVDEGLRWRGGAVARWQCVVAGVHLDHKRRNAKTKVEEQFNVLHQY